MAWIRPTTGIALLLAAAVTWTAPAAAQFQRQTPPETMQIEEQPGYEPSTEEERLPAGYQRQLVFFRTTAAPGTIIVRTSERRLYLVTGRGQALRYGIGVGRDGFTWSGVETVTRKAEWPDWTPPPEMLRRRPDLPRHMRGGPDNPMGARALYLGDTMYRIHGSNEPHTIGTATSSGCIRMTNDDIIDLYSRVRVGATVIVQR